MRQNTMLGGWSTDVSRACRLAWHLVVLLLSACSLLQQAAQTALETGLFNWRLLFPALAGPGCVHGPSGHLAPLLVLTGCPRLGLVGGQWLRCTGQAAGRQEAADCACI